MATQETITDGAGYAVGYDCHLSHAGNKLYARVAGDSWACQGCGYFVSSDHIAARQRAANPPRVQPVSYARPSWEAV